jgi:polyhydroxyalkanoate synthesis regulator phasin
MTVSAELRELWLEACREAVAERGLNIKVLDYDHAEPGKAKKHKNTRAFVRGEIVKLQKWEEDLQRREQDVQWDTEMLELRTSAVDAREDSLQAQEAGLNELYDILVKKGLKKGVREDYGKKVAEQIVADIKPKERDILSKLPSRMQAVSRGNEFDLPEVEPMPVKQFD